MKCFSVGKPHRYALCGLGFPFVSGPSVSSVSTPETRIVEAPERDLRSQIHLEAPAAVMPRFPGVQKRRFKHITMVGVEKA